MELEVNINTINYDFKYSELLLEELKESTDLFHSINILSKRQLYISFAKSSIILSIIKFLFKQYNSEQRKHWELEKFTSFLKDEKVINVKNSVGTYDHRTLWESFLTHNFNDIFECLENNQLPLTLFLL